MDSHLEIGVWPIPLKGYLLPFGVPGDTILGEWVLPLAGDGSDWYMHVLKVLNFKNV